MEYVSVTADLVVVGLGAVGSAALYQAAKLGARVTGIDRFHPPHDVGSSHGETRITRQAIGEGREYVPLVLRSHQIWEELEANTGRNLLTRNGALILQSPYIVGDHHGSTSFLADTVAAAKEHSIQHQVLSTEDVSERFPQFQLTQEEVGYFEPGAGFLRPEACIEAQLAAARQSGADIRTGETVLEVKPTASSVEIRTDRDTYAAGHAILTAGPWIARFLPELLGRQLLVYRQVMTWFAVEQNQRRYEPGTFPVFIWITGNRPCDMFYGFPMLDGRSIKTATERYDSPIDPDAVQRSIATDEVLDLHDNYIASRLPEVSDECVRAATCLYTVAPGARFMIDQADEHGRLLFASACSGHGFKHSAAVGEALARRAMGFAGLVDLSPFPAARATVKSHAN